MSNNFTKAYREKVLDRFIKGFEAKRILSKNVNTQLVKGAFNSHTGTRVAVKRPTDFKVIETPEGDITGFNPSPMIVGNAYATVQDTMTVYLTYTEFEEALEMGDKETVMAPKAARLVTALELKFAQFMARNTALLSGTLGTPVSAWSDIANFGAVMEASGIPKDGLWKTMINPYTEKALADGQRSLGAGGKAGNLVYEANEKAMIMENFAGLDVYTGVTLPLINTDAPADRAGTVAATPTATYESVMESIEQDLAITGFAANLVINAGETIRIPAVSRLNQATREVMVDETITPVVFTATVVNTVTLDGSGAGTIRITGAAVYEADGAHNTVDRAITSGDVVELLGAESSRYQPNLFWHRDAFVLGFAPLETLENKSTKYTSEDGIEMRITTDSEFMAAKNMVRIDIRPVFGVLNPYYAGKGFGIA